MKRQKSVVSIDWLQCLCKVNDIQKCSNLFITSSQTNEHGNHNTYSLKDNGEYTIGYENHRMIYLGKVHMATISWCPKRSNVCETNASIKLSNNLLYTNQWHFILGDILNALGWSLKGITRVDIACDLNHFLHGVRPECFVQRYIKGRNSSYIRCGSNKFSLYGEKFAKGTRIDYIRWGSRSSGVCTYLYNKSKELREQKYKPWIIDRWRSAGLDIKNVWRVEFSINSSGRGLKDIETGLIHTLFVDDLFTSQQVVSIFQSYAKRYFNFKQCGNGCPKLVKDMHTVELIDLSQASSMIPTTLYFATKKSSTLKNVIAEIEYVKDELINADSEANRHEIEALNTSSFILTRKLFAINHTENAIGILEDDITQRLVRSTNRLSEHQRLFRAQSYIDNEAYKNDICASTAKRIVKLLMSRASA